jgi:hypothetical protein
MQQIERSDEREVSVVRLLKEVHSSIIARGIDETIPEAKNEFITAWLSMITSEIIKWLVVIGKPLE